ncbi:MAG: dihydroneopterin aldolase family protein [Archaeoglobaceae archaeon]
MDEVRAAFEAGIKLGALFHQFVGAPVSEENAELLARAIESCVRLQPYVVDVRVEIDAKKANSAFGYTSLLPDMLYAYVEVKVGEATVRARLRWDEEAKYPVMELL